VTIRQIDLWRDSYTLWTYVVKNESIRTTIAHFNLGYACEKKGLLNEAIEQFQIVLAINPESTEARNSLGAVYDKKGLFDQAFEQYQLVVKLILIIV
jgi:tetratricopeptide (TPR) repeat protein